MQVLLAFIVTCPSEQSASPPQPAKVDPVVAVAVSVIAVSLVNDDEHVAPQFIPVGLDMTVPDPVPDLVTVRVKVVAVGLPETWVDSALSPWASTAVTT